jgi:hypothetical protein
MGGRWWLAESREALTEELEETSVSLDEDTAGMPESVEFIVDEPNDEDGVVVATRVPLHAQTVKVEEVPSPTNISDEDVITTGKPATRICRGRRWWPRIMARGLVVRQGIAAKEELTGHKRLERETKTKKENQQTRFVTKNTRRTSRRKRN